MVYGMRASTGAAVPGIVSQRWRAGSFHFSYFMTINPSVLAVIMGGGRGTRLYPYQGKVQAGGAPRWEIPAGRYPDQQLSELRDHRIFLLTQFNTASLHRHVQSTYHFDSFGRGLSTSCGRADRKEYQLVPGHRRCRAAQFRALPHLSARLPADPGGRSALPDGFRKSSPTYCHRGRRDGGRMPVLTSQVENLGVMRVDDNLEIKQFVEKPKDPAVIESLTISRPSKRA